MNIALLTRRTIESLRVFFYTLDILRKESMKTINQTYHIEAPVEKVWQCLVVPKEIDAWGGGPAKMNDEEGTKFTFWGGDIYGTNKEVHKEKKLVQEWYGGKWDKPSIATFTLVKEDEGTKVEFHQTDVPDEEAKSIKSGWEDYYLGAIKKYLEHGDN
jgi:activator of HSP90 ATPase